MQTRTIEGLFVRLSAWPLGGKPVLVFVHGSGNTGGLWDHQTEGLGDIADVVAVDLPGHGGSAKPHPTSIEEHANRVAQLIRGLDVDRVIVCGLSLGGAVAQQILLDHADIVAGGVLLGTGARLRVSPMILTTIEEDFEGYVQALPAVAASPKTDIARLRGVIEDAQRTGPTVTAADFGACAVFDVMDRLGEIDAPVLVIVGEDDRLTPPKYARFLADTITGARLVTLEAAGHLSPVEQPDAVNAAIRSWLEETAR